MVTCKNPKAKHLKNSTDPKINPSAHVHEQAFVCGDVTIGCEVFVAPFASVRADEGSPFYIGDFSDIQDGVVMHALETFEEDGSPIEKNLVEVGGSKFSIYIGKNVSLAHQAQVHGPAVVEDETFIGMQALIFRSKIGKGCVVEPCAKVIGVEIANGKYVPAGEIINNQAAANNLPSITPDYPYATLNKSVVKVNDELARAYNRTGDSTS